MHLTDQSERFTAFRIARETERLYPYRDTLQALHWSLES